VIDPKRGFVQITKRGLEFLKKDREEIIIEDLKKFPEFINFINHKKIKESISVNIEKISLLATPQEMIDSGFDEIHNKLKNDLLDKLRSHDPYDFEKIILKLFKKMGYGDYLETSKSGDGGIDGVIKQDVLGVNIIYTQAKRYAEKNKVGIVDINNFLGAMKRKRVEKGIFVTTSDFLDSAVKDIDRHSLILINGDMLVDLMIKYNLGIQIKFEYLVKEIDEEFFIED